MVLENGSERSWITFPPSETEAGSLFFPFEMEAILSNPTGGPSVRDTLVWAGSKDGQYTVKSSYYFLATSKTHENSHSSGFALSQRNKL
ncbi:hypothetical protein V6N12_070681 [Hibiscus sabdariffa]|uniref:Uncharacterized protein n=1 Tax=Hibiscus sabdariffa TaxID=183260 RepID=A0ABR2FI39_9ROSI